MFCGNLTSFMNSVSISLSLLKFAADEPRLMLNDANDALSTSIGGELTELWRP